jgi:membrane protease YdiL (CAAX protease family)
MRIVSFVLDAILACYIVWQVVQFLPQYRELKKAVAAGDLLARMRVYRKAVVFEWVSAMLALFALGFDWSKLTPRSLDLDGTPLMQMLSQWRDFDRGMFAGVLAGVVVGTAAAIVVRLRARQRGGTPRPSAARTLLRKLMPDFSALLPVTAHERLIWAFVAISAGICEEIVFRGWLLATLRSPIGLGGTALVVAAAAAFGFAHAYQGITGVVLTTLAGAFFCAVYLATGSLLVPIVLHILVDVRFIALPGIAPSKPREVVA